MKKGGAFILILICVLFIGVMAGVLIGRSAGTVPVSIHANDSSDSTVSLSTEISPSSGKVNINTADVHQLTMLPGIGETLAQRIIDYRETYGAFTTVDTLLEVEGIGEKRLEEISPYITTGG